MPTNVLRLSLIPCVLTLLAPAAAEAKRPAGETVRGVSAPRSVAAGARLALKVTVRNAAARPAPADKLRVLLSADRRRDARDVALSGKVEPPVTAEGASIKLAAKVCRRVGGS